MPPYGVTSAGFVAKDANTILSEIDDDLKTILGDSAGTDPDGTIPLESMAGQLKTLITDLEAAHWDLDQAIYSSFDPQQASGEALDNICAITGTTRLPATTSSVTAACCGTPGTVLLVGRRATVTTTNAAFVSTAQATIDAATAWAQSTAYTLGQRRTANDRVYEVITAGTSSGSGTGPSTTAEDITDGTVHWTYVGEGTGAVDVLFEADDEGPIGALAGALVTIATPVAGWQSARNLEDASVGSFIETDPALRVRREVELPGQGNTTADGIRAQVLQVGQGTNMPVTACTVFQNTTLVTNGDGLPGKSVEVLIERDTSDPDAEIAQRIWESVAAGIETYGTVTTTVSDSQGQAQTVKYSRPTAVPIWIILDVTYDAATFPADTAAGAALIEQAIVLHGSAYPTGYDVRSSKISGAAQFGPSEVGGAAVPGVLEVTSCLIGTVNPPVSSATVAINTRQRATFDTARITVNLTPGTP